MLSFLRRRPAVAAEPPPVPAPVSVSGSIPLSRALQLLREAGKDPFEVQFLARDIRHRQDDGEDTSQLEARFQDLASDRLRALGVVGEGEAVVVSLRDEPAVENA